ncbi:MAG: PAS domain S-box protein [Nitrospiraceae bacterium]|nr:MAG: PAS domain S-box protein [Nitrospiraceae bacterium]
MHTLNPDKRKSGISIIGDLPWGSHFCQFYQTKKDLLDIFVPYFEAGLENNELCVWVTSRVLGAEDVKKALKKAVPHFEKYTRNGQIEIIPFSRCHTGNGKPGKVIASMIDEAVSGGFEGLRLACSSCLTDEKPGHIPYGNKDMMGSDSKYGMCPGFSDVISRHNALAVFAYPRDRFDAIGLMEVVKNHRFALVKNAGKWEVLESSEARSVKDALKRSEEKLHSLFSNMSEGFAYHKIVLDDRGKPCDYIFLEINESFERLTGLKGKDIIGKKVTEALPGIEKDSTDWIGKYGKVAMTGKPLQFESYSEALNKWFFVSAFSPHKGYFAVTFSDITERKKYEDALIRAKLEWERTFDSVPDLIAILDNRHRVVRVNRAMANQLGLTPEDCVGMPCYKYVHGMSEPPAFCPHSQTIKDGCQHFSELFEDRLGGDMLVSTTPILNEQGEITGSVHVARNISELKQAERSLIESEKRLNKSQEIAHLGSWELDLTNNRLYWSDEVYRIFGLKPQEFSATYQAFLEAVHPDDRAAVDAAYSSSLREGRDTYEIEHRVVRKATGEVRIVHEKCEHFRDETGRIIRSAGMVHDITGRKKVEEEREHLLEELVRSNKELEQFAFIASHDLQEPLRTISSYVQLINHRYKDRLDGDAEEFINYVVSGTTHMQKLLNDLLSYSRAGSHGEPFKLTDLNSVISKATANLKIAIDGSSAVIEHESLPAVFADEVQMVQVFQNLIGNAIKFRSEDPPSVHIAADMDRNEWVICVSDNGIGINPKYFSRIFHVFKRLHSREKYDGTGIGLAICKKIVERHGGRIWVKSEPGKGSTFCFTIPNRSYNI